MDRPFGVGDVVCAWHERAFDFCGTTVVLVGGVYASEVIRPFRRDCPGAGVGSVIVV